MAGMTPNYEDGTPIWVDLGTTDVSGAAAFYGALFGWTHEDLGPEAGGYGMFRKDGQLVAGVGPATDQSRGTSWATYFQGNVDDAASRVAANGGVVIAPPMDVMDQGRMAIALDPQGAQFGLWHGMAMHGADLVNEPGAFTWNELVTPDAAGAAAFYSAVFDRPVESMNVPDMDYRTFKVDGRDVAGVYGLPDAPAARWTTYFAVADADEAARTVLAHGGTVVAEPKDSPYGRFGILRDPFGAEFAAMKLPENPPE